MYYLRRNKVYECRDDYFYYISNKIRIQLFNSNKRKCEVKQEKDSIVTLKSKIAITSISNKEVNKSLEYKLYFADCNIGTPVKNLNYKIVTSLESQIDIIIIENNRPWIASNIPLLYGINKGIPIVIRKWLKDSNSQGYFIPYEKYIFTNEKIEKKYKISLLRTYEKIKQEGCSYLKDHKFYVHNNVEDYNDLICLIKSAQGQIICEKPSKKVINTYIVVKKLTETEDNSYTITSEPIKKSVLLQKININ